MVETIKRTDSKLDSSSIPFMLPPPKSVVIRFGRAFVVVVETSKKTLQIFQNSIKHIREFIEELRVAILSASKEFLTLEPAAYSPYYDTFQREQFPLRQAPSWKMRILEQRACKQIPLLDPKAKTILRVAKKALTQITGNATANSPIETTKFGAGIPNGQNCCFMASVLQALRVSPSFRTRLKAKELKNMPVVQELRKIYDTIEGTSKETKRTLTSSEINHFRTTCIESGFQIDSFMSQEDSSHFCQFLLGQVGFEEFKIKEHNDHSFEIPVNALDKGLPLTENQVVFQLANSEVSEIKDLIQKRKMVVEVERKHVEKDLQEKELLTEEILEKLRAMKDIELVPVEQTMQLYRTNLPHVLPLYLERANYDRTTHQTSLNMHKIIPNEQIDFPLADMPGYAARYEWLSAVTREQPTSSLSSQVINKDSGHYGAWARYDNNGEAIFTQFDSSSARLHTDTAPEALDSITQNSRLLVYEYRGIVKA